MKPLLQHATIVAALVLTSSLASAEPPIPDVRNAAEIARHFDRKASIRVLNVWATWCAPCVAEMPALQAIHADYRRRGVSVVALSMDDALPGDRAQARARVAKFVDSNSITFPSVLYLGSLPAIESELQIRGEIPVTIVFDAKGRELARVEGILEEREFRAELDRMLSSNKPSAR